MREKPVALVDLDGTLADFDGAMRAQLVLLDSPQDVARAIDMPEHELYGEKHPHMKFRRDLVKRQPGFWEGLPVLPLGMSIVEILRRLDYEIHVLSKGPVTTTSAWTEKVHWVQKHLGAGTPITMTHDKGLVYGRVLVDDWPPYIEAWLAYRPRGFVVMPAQPWNGPVPRVPARASAALRRGSARLLRARPATSGREGSSLGARRGSVTKRVAKKIAAAHGFSGHTLAQRYRANRICRREFSRLARWEAFCKQFGSGLRGRKEPRASRLFSLHTSIDGTS